MTRLISGVVLAALAIAAIVWLPIVALRVLATVVAGLAAHELASILKSAVAARAIVLAVVACWLVSIPAPVPFLSAAAAVIVAIVLAVIAITAADRWAPGAATRQASGGVLAAVYIGMPLGMLVAVQALRGWRATLLLLGTIVVSDSAQYYTGRAFGRRPLAPTISPKKTIEGAIGGLIFGTAFFALASSYVLPDAQLAATLVLGLLMVALGISGDLFESKMKRAAGMKDSANLIPGHGGVLDRIDALLFAVPPFYLYIRAIT
jgi:phosphatidate cytidylyltransferase